MPRLTRRCKKNRKNKSIRQNGGENEREGVVDMVGDKIAEVASSAAKTIGDAGLKIIGLERINKENNLQETGESPGIISNVKNVADKTGAAIIENVNEVLGSEAAKETTEQAAEQNATILKKGAETFNNALNNPEVKQEVEEAIEHAGEIGSVVVKASEKPFNEAVDAVAKAVPKVTSAAVSGAIKVGTDALGAVPFWGAIIDMGKMVNDGSKAASAVVEASSEAAEVASDAFIETKENIEKGLQELDEKKRISEQISNRTKNSINNFENPIMSIQTGGVRKTRRRLFKRKKQSKRVRFAV